MITFLEKVLPNNEDWKFLFIMSQTGRPYHIAFTDCADMAVRAYELDAEGNTVYFACAAFKKKQYLDDAGKRHQRTAENANSVKAFWLDIDCNEEKAKNGKGYATKREALKQLKSFYKAVNLPRPMLIDSGGGLHVYWTLTEVITPEEWFDTAEKLKTLTKSQKYHLMADDTRTADVASVLRPLNTRNQKKEYDAPPVVSMLGDADAIPFAQFKGAIDKSHMTVAPIAASNMPHSVGEANAARAISLEVLRDMLEHIAPGPDRNDWWQVLAAVANYFGEAAYDLTLEWSRGDFHPGMDSNYEEEEFEKQFRDCLTRRGQSVRRYGLPTIIESAKKGGWSQDQVGEIMWLEELNADYAWCEKQKSIYRFNFGDFIEPQKFQVQYSNRIVQVPTSNGHKSSALGQAWLKSSGRRQHPDLVFQPGQPKVTDNNCINSWNGLQIDPCKGNIEPFTDLMKRLVPNKDAFVYMLQWMAHKFQRPDVKMNTALVVWSKEQGPGKNLLFECLTKIIGNEHATVIGQNQLGGDFNSWAKNRILIIGDEVFSGDKRSHADRMKGLITGTRLLINEKFQPEYEIENFCSFIFLSNHGNALYIDPEDRRYFIWEVKAARLPECEVKAFITWRDNGGLAALLDSFLLFSLKNFDPTAPAPMTQAKELMIDDGRTSLELWADDLLRDNPQQLLGREVVTAQEMLDKYSLTTNDKRSSLKAMTNALKNAGAQSRIFQIRLQNGRKVRPLSLANHSFWHGEEALTWVNEFKKTLK